eukprot:SM000067S20314  [mRNA]  locus=s67:341472:344002:+ [translate_table: standard]
MVHWPRRWRRAASRSAAATAPTKKKAPPLPPPAAQSSFSAAPFVYLAAGAAAPALLRFVPEEYSREASSAVLPPPPQLLPSSDGELSPAGGQPPLLEAPAFGAGGGKKRAGGLRLSMVVHHVVMAVVPAPALVPTAAAGGGGGCSCLVSRLLRSRPPQQATIAVAVLSGLLAMAAFASTDRGLGSGGAGRATMRLTSMLLAAAFLTILAFWLSLWALAARRQHRQFGDRPLTAAPPPAAASTKADDDEDRKLATLSHVNVASSHELAGTRGGRHSRDSEAPSVYVCRSLPISPLMQPVAAIRGVDAGGSHASGGNAGNQLGGSVSASLPSSPTTGGCLSWQRSAASYSRSYDRPLLRPVTPPPLSLAGSPPSQAAVAAAAEDNASGSSSSLSDNTDNVPELAASSATVALSAMENAATGAVDMPPNVLVRTSSEPDVHRTPVKRHHRGFRRLFRPSLRAALDVADRSASPRSSIAAAATASAAAGSGGESLLPSSPMATRSAPSSPAVRRWSRHAAAAAAAGPPPATACVATHFYQSRRAAAAVAASAEELASPMAMGGERRHSVASAVTRLQEGFVLPAACSAASPSAVSAESPAAAPVTAAAAEPPPRQSRSGMALALTLVVVLSALFLGRIPAVAAAVCVIVLASRVRGAEPLSSSPPPAEGDVAPSPEQRQLLAGPDGAATGAGRGRRRLQAVPEGHHSEGSNLQSRFRSPIADILQHSHTTDPSKQAVLAGLLSREQHGPAAGPAAAAYLR